MAPVRCSGANCKASEALTASRLDSPHARRAQPTVRSLFDLVCDAFSALERLTVIDRADVHEHVWRVRLGVEHEATPLLALEEFHGAGETNIGRHRPDPITRSARNFKTSATQNVRNNPTRTHGNSPRSARCRIEFSLTSSNRAAADVLIRSSITGAFTMHPP